MIRQLFQLKYQHSSSDGGNCHAHNSWKPFGRRQQSVQISILIPHIQYSIYIYTRKIEEILWVCVSYNCSAGKCDSHSPCCIFHLLYLHIELLINPSFEILSVYTRFASVSTVEIFMALTALWVPLHSVLSFDCIFCEIPICSSFNCRR